jgi:hypothetical protein
MDPAVPDNVPQFIHSADQMDPVDPHNALKLMDPAVPDNVPQFIHSADQMDPVNPDNILQPIDSVDQMDLVDPDNALKLMDPVIPDNVPQLVDQADHMDPWVLIGFHNINHIFHHLNRYKLHNLLNNNLRLQRDNLLPP